LHMVLKFVFDLPTELFPVKKEWRLWLKKLDRAFWDLIFIGMENEKDEVGASLIAHYLSLFFPFSELNYKVIMKLYPLRGWERDLLVPFPYLLYVATIREVKSPDEVLLVAYSLFLSRVIGNKKGTTFRAKILREILTAVERERREELKNEWLGQES